MKVAIKHFDVAMEIKNKGIEIDVSDPQDVHIGDLLITKSRLVWCKGKTSAKNGYHITWKKFIEYMENVSQ